MVSNGLAVPQIKKRCLRPVVPAVNRVSHDPCVKTHQRIRDQASRGEFVGASAERRLIVRSASLRERE